MKHVLRIIVMLLLSISLIACNSGDGTKSDPTKDSEENSEQKDETNKEDEEDTDAPDTTVESGKGGFLWSVENGDTTVYLQGTIHLGTENFYPFHEKIEQAYEDADVIVPEVDITDEEMLSDLGPAISQGMYMDGTTIEDHISEELYEKLEGRMAAYGLQMSVVESFKPWMLDSLIMQLVAEELDFMHGVDMYFLERAKEDNKEIIELESAAEQYDVLSGQSDEFQARQLEESLDAMDEFGEMMEELFTVYLDGDEEALLELLFSEDEEIDEEIKEEYEEYMKALNEDRNVGMAEKIQGFLEEDTGKTYFVIVGTAHLVEDPHVRTLLEEEGYEVERVY